MTNIIELEKTYKKFEEFYDKASRELVTIKESRKFIENLKNEVPAALESDSVAWRVFDRESNRHTDWWVENLSGYVNSENMPIFERWFGVPQLTLNAVEPEFLRLDARFPNQNFFSSRGCI